MKAMPHNYPMKVEAGQLSSTFEEKTCCFYVILKL